MQAGAISPTPNDDIDQKKQTMSPDEALDDKAKTFRASADELPGAKYAGKQDDDDDLMLKPAPYDKECHGYDPTWLRNRRDWECPWDDWEYKDKDDDAPVLTWGDTPEDCARDRAETSEDEPDDEAKAFNEMMGRENEKMDKLSELLDEVKAMLYALLAGEPPGTGDVRHNGWGGHTPSPPAHSPVTLT